MRTPARMLFGNQLAKSIPKQRDEDNHSSNNNSNNSRKRNHRNNRNNRHNSNNAVTL